MLSSCFVPGELYVLDLKSFSRDWTFISGFSGAFRWRSVKPVVALLETLVSYTPPSFLHGTGLDVSFIRCRAFLPQRCSRFAIYWQPSSPQHCILCLSTHVRRYNVSYFFFLILLTWPTIAASSENPVTLHFYMTSGWQFIFTRPMIAIGAVAERGRLGPLILFVFVWSTIVYGTTICSVSPSSCFW